jgi:hypothetical protein
MEDRYRILVIILLIVGSINFLVTATELLPYDYDLDYSEGFMIEDSQRLAETGELYPSPSLENGLESVKYTPFFYVLFSFLGSIFGFSFLMGRIISFLSLLGTLWISHLIVREYLPESNSPILLPLLILVPYLSMYTGLNIRVDMMAIFFSALGVLLFIKERLYLSLIPFTLAFFTKQTYIAGFAACCFYLWSQNDGLKGIERVKDREIRVQEYILKHKELTKLLLLYTTALLTGITILHYWSSGNFLTNIISANVGGWELRYDLLNWTTSVFFLLFSLTAYYLYIYRDKLLGTYFIFALVIALVQMLRGGAWVYPIMEPFVVSVIATTVLYHKHPLSPDKISLILLAQLVIFMVAPPVNGTVFDIKSFDERNSATDNKIISYIENSEKPLFTEHTGYQITQNIEPSPEIWGMYEQHSSNKVQTSQIQEFFKRKNYSIIATYLRIDNLPIENYIENNYKLEKEIQRNDMLLNEERWRIYKWTG